MKGKKTQIFKIFISLGKYHVKIMEETMQNKKGESK